MTTIELYLSDDDMDRLFAIIKKRNLDMTAETLAKQLLIKAIHQEHPQKVKFDEESGEIK